MRITDLPVATPLNATARATAKKSEDATSARTAVVTSGRTEGASHPDEVAAAALQKAAASAQSTRLVAAQNQLASESVRGEIDPERALKVG